MNKISKRNNSATVIALIVFSTILFAYTFFRALFISITWDETYTYLEFIKKGILLPQNGEQMLPNYHLLLTFMDIYLVKLFGVSELVLRLPSLLGHILFLFYSIKLILRFENKWLILASFFILNLNPYLLDYFSLARGYGLSYGLLMASIYYLFLFYSDKTKNKFAVLSVVLAVFASLSNLVLINYCFVLYSCIVLFQVIKCIENNKKLYKIIIIHSILSIVLLGLTLPIVLHLKETVGNSYGGYNSFWSDTLSETINTNFYTIGFNIYLHWFVKGFVLLIIVASLSKAIISFRKKRKYISFSNVLLYILLLCALSTIMQHWLFGTLYLTNRTALFFVILFNLLFVYFINETMELSRKLVLVPLVICCISVLHFIYSINFKYVLDWKPDADTKTIFVDLEKIKTSSQGNKSISVFVSPLLEEGFSFYNSLNEQTKFVANSNENEMYKRDYLMLDEQTFSNINKDSVEVLKIYPTTKNVLAKTKFN